MLAASVIVPARDAEGTLPRTLEALARQQIDGGYEVIVVDDGSRDATSRLAGEAPGPVRVIRQPRLGPARARNRGVAEAQSPRLAFCDADVFPEPGWLAAGVAALRDADLVQGRVLPDPSAPIGPFDRSIWVTHEAGLYEAASLFVTAEAFGRAGGFTEWIRPVRGKALAEDVWFGWTLRRDGARTGFCTEALAYHAVFPRGWREYCAERARLRFFPAMAAKMPELRDSFLHRRWFLNRRTARFDLACLGGGSALQARSPWPLIAALPYARTLWRDSARSQISPAARAAVVGADLAADVTGAVALAAGSLRHRALVI